MYISRFWYSLYNSFFKKISSWDILKNNFKKIPGFYSDMITSFFCALDISRTFVFFKKSMGALLKVILRTIHVQKIRNTRLYLLRLELVYCLNANTSKMQASIRWWINSSKRKQNKSKANIISRAALIKTRRYNQLEKGILGKRRAQ